MAENNSKKKKAKFFCENCGHEVAEDAKVCRHCGKFFISVRCPKCGKVGSADIFKKGCPQCGYSMKDDSALKAILESVKDGRAYGSDGGETQTSLPIWVYIITFLGLVAVIAGVYFGVSGKL